MLPGKLGKPQRYFLKMQNLFVYGNKLLVVIIIIFFLIGHKSRSWKKKKHNEIIVVYGNGFQTCRKSFHTMSQNPNT